MGLEEGPGAIRVSLEPNAQIESVDQFLDVLRKIVARHERSKAS
jgi:cysteine desulfurase